MGAGALLLIVLVLPRCDGLSSDRSTLAAVRRASRTAPGSGVAAQELRRNASRALFEGVLASDDVAGADKHAAICAHLKRVGARSANACPRCWVHEAACCCLPPVSRAPVDVVLWMHHREWGRASNTGTALRDAVKNCELLMKGHPDDDARLARILERPAAVLFPSEDAVPIASLERVEALIVVDASWRNARRMANALPASIPRVRLDDGDAAAHNMLAPLRRTVGREGVKVCTAQAAVAALGDVGWPRHHQESALAAARRKIDVVAALRGKKLPPE